MHKHLHISLRSFALCFVSCALLFLPHKTVAQTKDSTTAKRVIVAQKDIAPIVFRKPSEKRLDEYRSNKDYQYDRDVLPPENPIAKFWYWLKSKIAEFFRSKAYDSFWQYVFLAGIVALASWLIYKSNLLGNMFVGQSRKYSDLDFELINENIHELNFTDLIDEAVEQRNYRLAVRLYYLKTLKLLSDKGLINWKPTKTNHAYLYELANSSLGADFEQITRQFEYVWYGEFAVSEDEFSEIKNDFQTFAHAIS